MLKIFKNKKFLILIALVNFIAGIYGITYYLPQLNQTNPLLWIFVIDCPLAAIIFAFALVFRFKEKDIVFLSFIAIVGNIKFAVWTFLVLFLMNTWQSYLYLTVSHFLLLIEVILFYKLFHFKVKHVLFALIWFLLNDLSDYVLGTHPFFSGINYEFLAIFSILSTFIFILGVSIVFSLK